MGTRSRRVAALTVLMVFGACSPQRRDTEREGARLEAHASAESAVVAEYTAAFNAHDAEAMRGLMADDIVWLSIVGDSLVVEAAGADALVSGMVAYFTDFPDVTSEVETGDRVGAYVHARETATWSDAGVTSSQSSLSTYEIRQGKVVRVWYFPSGS